MTAHASFVSIKNERRMPDPNLDVCVFISRPAFIIRSDRKVPTPAMPMPDLAVPYAAPIAAWVYEF